MGVLVLAQTGLSFDLDTPNGKLMRTIMAGSSEFERDLIRERVRSGLAAAKAAGKRLGRQQGQRPSDKEGRQGAQSACSRALDQANRSQRRPEQEHRGRYPEAVWAGQDAA